MEQGSNDVLIGSEPRSSHDHQHTSWLCGHVQRRRLHSRGFVRTRCSRDLFDLWAEARNWRTHALDESCRLSSFGSMTFTNETLSPHVYSRRRNFRTNDIVEVWRSPGANSRAPLWEISANGKALRTISFIWVGPVPLRCKIAATYLGRNDRPPLRRRLRFRPSLPTRPMPNSNQQCVFGINIASLGSGTLRPRAFVQLGAQSIEE
jgi:hypothetical protein